MHGKDDHAVIERAIEALTARGYPSTRRNYRNVTNEEKILTSKEEDHSSLNRRNLLISTSLGALALFSHLVCAIPMLHDALPLTVLQTLMSPYTQCSLATVAMLGPARSMLKAGVKV